MGMSASQGRYLQLTARQNNAEFEIQMLTQAKMTLANQMDTEALLWSDGMNMQHLYYSPTGDGGSTADMQRLSYQLVTGKLSEGGLAMSVRDTYGREVVTELPEPMPEGKTVANYAIQPYCNQALFFENNLKTGNWILQKTDDDGKKKDVSVDGANFIYQGADKNDYDVANNSYEEKSRQLQRVDKNYDMRISQLTQEQNAIQTEMDSVKKVIDKNIEETFKTFG